MFSPTLTTVALSGDVGVMTAKEAAASASATRDLANMAIDSWWLYWGRKSGVCLKGVGVDVEVTNDCCSVCLL